MGQAFNAVYDVGTSLGKSIESGKIAIKDYEDEEGKKLTGLALDRAKMDDYAAIEQKLRRPDGSPTDAHWRGDVGAKPAQDRLRH